MAKSNVFFPNRIAAIQQQTKNMHWKYVPTSLNSADMLSKGFSPHVVLFSSLWLHGPNFDCMRLKERSRKMIHEIRYKVMLLSDCSDTPLTSLDQFNEFSDTPRDWYTNSNSSEGTIGVRVKSPKKGKSDRIFKQSFFIITFSRWALSSKASSCRISVTVLAVWRPQDCNACTLKMHILL